MTRSTTRVHLQYCRLSLDDGVDYIGLVTFNSLNIIHIHRSCLKQGGIPAFPVIDKYDFVQTYGIAKSLVQTCMSCFKKRAQRGKETGCCRPGNTARMDVADRNDAGTQRRRVVSFARHYMYRATKLFVLSRSVLAVLGKKDQIAGRHAVAGEHMNNVARKPGPASVNSNAPPCSFATAATRLKPNPTPVVPRLASPR